MVTAPDELAVDSSNTVHILTEDGDGWLCRPKASNHGMDYETIPRSAVKFDMEICMDCDQRAR